MNTEQKKKREKIVKAMKRNMKDFRARYGEDAKDVMYATATKMAVQEAADEDTPKPSRARKKSASTSTTVSSASAPATPAKKVVARKKAPSTSTTVSSEVKAKPKAKPKPKITATRVVPRKKAAAAPTAKPSKVEPKAKPKPKITATAEPKAKVSSATKAPKPKEKAVSKKTEPATTTTQSAAPEKTGPSRTQRAVSAIKKAAGTVKSLAQKAYAKAPGVLRKVKGYAKAAYERGKTPENVKTYSKGTTIDFTRRNSNTSTSGGQSAKIAFSKIRSDSASEGGSSTQKTASPAKTAIKRSTTKKVVKKTTKSSSDKPLSKKEADERLERLLNNPNRHLATDTGRSWSKSKVKESMAPVVASRLKRRVKKQLHNVGYVTQKVGVRAESVLIACDNILESVDEGFSYKEVQNTKGPYSHKLTIHGAHKNKKDHIRVDLMRTHSDPEGHWRLSDVRKTDKKGVPVNRTYDPMHANTIGPKDVRGVARHLNTTYGIKSVRALRVTGASAKDKEPHELKPKTFRLEHYVGVDTMRQFLDERNMENKAKKNAYVKSVGKAAAQKQFDRESKTANVARLSKLAGRITRSNRDPESHDYMVRKGRRKLTREEVIERIIENFLLQELSKDTLKRYVYRARDSREDARNDKRYTDAAQRAHIKSHGVIKKMYSDWSDELKKKIDKRSKGMLNAAEKL
jgi:hypothetical protein